MKNDGGGVPGVRKGAVNNVVAVFLMIMLFLFLPFRAKSKFSSRKIRRKRSGFKSNRNTTLQEIEKLSKIYRFRAKKWNDSLVYL